jgi:hypothetical protein
MIARRGWLAAEAAPKGGSTKRAQAGLVEPNAPPSWVAFHVDNSQTLGRLYQKRSSLLKNATGNYHVGDRGLMTRRPVAAEISRSS